MSKIYSFSYAMNQLSEVEHDVLWNEELVVFDCRGLPDPEGLGVGPDGRDWAVQEYVTSNLIATDFLKAAFGALLQGHSVAFGCYAGKNRSVAMAETLANSLPEYVEPDHRGLKKWDQAERDGFWMP
jgi:RNase adaptor protein for sRNA GlmZ degradation